MVLFAFYLENKKIILKIEQKFENKNAAPAKAVAVLPLPGNGIVVFINAVFILGAHIQYGFLDRVGHGKAVVFQAFRGEIGNVQPSGASPIIV